MIGFLMSMNNGDAMDKMVGLISRVMLNGPFQGILLRMWGI